MAHPATCLVRQTLTQYLAVLGNECLRHGNHLALAKDVVLETLPLLRPQARTEAEGLLTEQQLDASALSSLMSTNLSRRRVSAHMDRALQVLRLTTERGALLQQLASEPLSSSNSSAGLAVSSQSWLSRPPPEHSTNWQFEYAVTLTNDSSQPVQVMKRSWRVLDLCGRIRNRSSMGIQGLQPVIEAGDSFTYRAPVTLSSFKGGVEGCFDLVALSSRAALTVQLPPLGLTLTDQEYQQLQPLAPLLAGGQLQPTCNQQPSAAGSQEVPAPTTSATTDRLPLQQISSTKAYTTDSSSRSSSFTGSSWPFAGSMQ